MSAAKLPRGLPPLPPLPDGWDAWEYVPRLEGFQNAPWTRLNEGKWWPSTDFNPAMNIGYQRGDICIRAVKRAKKKAAHKKCAEPTEVEGKFRICELPAGP